MISPQQVKMELQCEAQKRAVTIVGVHSVRLADDETVDALFDIFPPDESGDSLLNFRFPLPELVKRDDIHEFSFWLILEDDRKAIH